MALICSYFNYIVSHFVTGMPNYMAPATLSKSNLFEFSEQIFLCSFALILL